MNQATNEPTISLTDALALHGIGLSAANANKVLQGAGMTETRWRNSSVAGRPQKSFRAATPLGESMGIINEAATLAHWRSGDHQICAEQVRRVMGPSGSCCDAESAAFRGRDRDEVGERQAGDFLTVSVRK